MTPPPSQTLDITDFLHFPFLTLIYRAKRLLEAQEAALNEREEFINQKELDISYKELEVKQRE